MCNCQKGSMRKNYSGDWISIKSEHFYNKETLIKICLATRKSARLYHMPVKLQKVGDFIEKVTHGFLVLWYFTGLYF